MDEFWKAAADYALPVLAVFAKGTIAALVVGGLSQLTVEYLISPAAASEKTPEWVTFLSSGPLKRLTTLLFAQMAVVACHGLDIWTYGTGPKGYFAAAFFGFLAGGLAPWAQDQIKARVAKPVQP